MPNVGSKETHKGNLNLKRQKFSEPFTCVRIIVYNCHTQHSTEQF